MRLFTRKKIKSKDDSQSTREEFVSTRREKRREVTPEIILQESYRQNRMLNTRHGKTPAETSDRIAAHIISHKRIKTAKRGAVFLGVVVVCLALISQFTGSVSVQTPDTTSAKFTDQYKATLNEYYAQRPIERLQFLTDMNALKEFFLKKNPEVKTVRIESGGLGSGRMKLTFRQPVAQWSSGDRTYFVDDDGVTFERNYFPSPSVIVKDQSGIPATAGQEVINRQFLGFLGQTVSHFKQYNMRVTEAVLPPQTVRQLNIIVEGLPYTIKMTSDRKASSQVKQVMHVIGLLKEKSAQPQYIDVRVDQRVFYQ